MPRPTKTLIGAKARKAIYEGVNAIAVPVIATFGPQGKNALLYRSFNRGSRITNDGVTVAQTQEPRDPHVRLVAEAFKEACIRTNEKVGDGTTATALLGGTLFNNIHNSLTNTESEFSKKTMGVMTLRKDILESAGKVKEMIKKSATKIEKLEDLEKIATVSVEDPELGKTIAKMSWEVGVDGHIDVVEGYKGEIETEIIKGMRFPAKVPAKAFVNNPARYEMSVKDCPVLITNYALDNANELAKALNELGKHTAKIIIIAPSFSENVLVNMVNATKGGYFMFPVNVPALRTEQFEDLAIYCKATFIDKAKGRTLKSITPNDLGFLEKLIVKDTEAREDAVATGGRGTLEETMTEMGEEVVDGKKKKKVIEKKSTAIAERIAVLKSQVIETQQPQFKKLLERRIASMGSAIGVIRVGDSTQASSMYRKLKIEDAVYACKAALRGGYVKGGGLCLKEISEKLEGEDVLKTTLMAPYEQIQNSVDGGVEIGEEIIDPMEAIYYAVEHSTSVVANLITVEVITQELEDAAPGEGEFAIARALNEFVLNDKIHKGQLKENEREIMRDSMNGLTVDETVMLDNG